MENNNSNNGEIDKNTVLNLYQLVCNGSASKLNRFITTHSLQRSAESVLNCRPGSNFKEKTAIPRPAIEKADQVPFSHLIVEKPTLLVSAVCRGHASVVEELLKLPSATDFIDASNHVFEVNVKGQVEWAANEVTALMVACILGKMI